MAEKKSQARRFLNILGRRVKGSRAVAARSPAEENAIWTAHEQAVVHTHAAADAAQRLATTSAKQRSAADALGERATSLAARSHELAASFARITDAFERLSLVALNAGLEGARLGEATGQSLLLVSDEVRAHTMRGSESARELSSTLNEVGAELTKLHAHIDQARQASGDASQEAARLAASSAEADRALGQIGDQLRRVTGSDPETLKAIAEAGEHAKAIVASLSGLNGKTSRSILLEALRPALEPLVRILADDDDAANEEQAE